MFAGLLRSTSATDFFYKLAVVLLIIIISAFILRFLWNKALVPYVTILRPINTLLDAFLLTLAISVVRGY